jgi:glycerol-3-phosphate dehydrogenase (NAD(P)+)
MNVTILGCGRWGTFLGWYADMLGHEVMIWGRSTSKNLRQLRENRKNEYLKINNKILLSDSLSEAIKFSDYIIISINSQNLRELCRRINKLDIENKTFILAMKGIEKGTGLRLTQVFSQEIQQNVNLAIWVGPSQVQDLINSIPNCMVISSSNIDITKNIISLFNSSLIRLYIGQDLIGNEVGAAAKNVIGIIAGMLDGLNYSSLKGALMARGSREISRLVRAMGGNELTIYGLSHIGDYESTLFSKHSRNRAFGEAYIKKDKFEKLAEGVSTLESIILLSKKYDVSMPITEAVYSIIIDGKNPLSVLQDLFLRTTTYEF